MMEQPPVEKTPEYYEKLLEKHGLLRSPLEPAKRERLLPTKDQLRVVLAFLDAVETCRSTKGIVGVEWGYHIPAYSYCVGETVRKKIPEVELAIQRNPEWFEKLYSRVYW